MAQTIQVVKVADLKTTFFVRGSLNDGVVSQYRDFYAHGADFPPIEVTSESREVVDGRHRLEAQIQIGRAEVQCVFVKDKSRAELMADAVKANLGGSLAPTKADIVGVIRQLLTNGSTGNDIQEVFKRKIPPGVVRAYLKDARKLIERAKLKAASNEVLNGGVKLSDAAEKHGVTPEALKEELGGKRRKQREFDPDGVKKAISGRYRGVSSETGQQMKHLMDDFQEGSVSYEHVTEVLDQIDDLQKGAQRALVGWRARFAEAAGKPQE